MRNPPCFNTRKGLRQGRIKNMTATRMFIEMFYGDLLDRKVFCFVCDNSVDTSIETEQLYDEPSHLDCAEKYQSNAEIMEEEEYNLTN